MYLLKPQGYGEQKNNPDLEMARIQPVETVPKFQKENKLKWLLQKLATVSVCQKDTSVKPLSTKICDDFFHPIVHGWMTFFICCLELQKCSSLAADILYKIFNFILLLIV